MVVAPEHYLPSSKDFKKNIHEVKCGNILQILRDEITPTDCAFIRMKNIQLEFFLNIVSVLPLIPQGSLWVCLREQRDPKGCMSLLQERLSLGMTDVGWYLADKVYWTVGKNTPQGTLIGTKNSYLYLGSSGTSLRFTKNVPKDCWCNLTNNNNIWIRTLDEEASWYEPFITATCPENGIVLDLDYVNEFIGEAATNLGRKFIGIKL